MNSWHVAVLIPARNEEELLPRCLQSVIDACSALPADITTDVIVVSDRSTDQTLKVATQLLGDRGVAFEVGFSCVGMARLVAAAVALRRCQSPPKWCWLANTDADCEVPPDWLADQLLFANKGAAAVAGTIAVDSFTEHQPQVAELFREAYLIHADGTHPHVHGANLGIRADAYLDAGGWEIGRAHV